MKKQTLSIFIFLMIISLTATNTFTLNPTFGGNPSVSTRDEVILHYDGENAFSIGTGGVLTFIACARYTNTELAGYDGAQLERIQFYLSDAPTAVTLKVYLGLTSAEPGTLLLSQEVTGFTPNSWNDIALDNALQLSSSEEYWIGYEVTTLSGLPAGCDAGPVVADKGAKMYYNNSWSNLIDINSSLDVNFNIRAVLQTSNSVVITVGTGTTLNMSLPIEPYYGYSYSQCIYLQSEIATPNGSISRIWYHYNGGTDLSSSSQWVIYMGHTTMSAFPTNSSWVPYSDLTIVGTYTLDPYPTDAGWIEFVLDIPFAYNHIDNLVIGVEDNQGGWDGSGDDFYCTSTPDYRGIEYHNDSTNPNPESPPNGILRMAYANVQLEFIAVSGEPFFYINPTSMDFGTVFTSFSSDFETFTITNHGGSDLIISNPITMETGNYFTLFDFNTYPMTLPTLSSANIEVTFNPVIGGLVTDNIIIIDNVTRETHSIPVQGTGFDITVYDYPYVESFDTNTLPIGWVINPIVSSDSWEIANSEIGGHGAISEATGNGGYMMVIDDSNPQTVPAHLYTPPLDLAALFHPILGFKYWIGDANNTSELHIDVITSTGTDASIAIITDPDGATAWDTYEVDLAAFANQVVRLDFRGMESISFYGDISIDDVSIYEIGQIPDPTTLVAPLDGSMFVSTDGQFEWGPIINASGYFLSLGTDNPPSNVYNQLDVGNFVSYNFNSLATGTTYYWQITPYNSAGNAENCPVWSFSTIPTGLIEIGDEGASNQHLPIEPYYGYSYTQSIYLQSELNVTNGQIEQISYHYNNYATLNNCNSWVIYLAETSKVSFESTSDWMPINQFVEVYNGPLPTIQNDGWIYFDLTAPFAYNNVDNLAIAVEENQSGYTPSGNEDFYCTSVAENRSIYYYNDSYNPNPISPPNAGSILAYIPNVRILFTDYNSVPNIAIPTYPQANATGVGLSGSLTWDDATGANGYYVSFGTDYPPTDISDMTDVGNVTFYDFSNLSTSTSYYWQITPYNLIGNAVNCPIRGFTTRAVSDRLSVPNEFSTIQTAINASIDGETVLVQSGTYLEKIDFMGKGITVASLFYTTGDSTYIENTIINGNSLGSCVSFSNGETNSSVFSGFTVTNGFATDGGGILCQAASPTILHSVILNNEATDGGGGIKIDGNSLPILEYLVVTGNSALNGGGISITGGADVNADNLLVYQNASANRAGGLEVMNSTVSITNSAFKYNTATNNGGALFMSDGTLDVYRCLLDNNAADQGGGIYLQGDNQLTNKFCTYVDNSALLGGNCLFVDGATAGTFVNSIYQSQGLSEIGFTGSPSNLGFYYSRIISTPQAIENANESTVYIDPSVIADDPLFVDPLIQDYSLAFNSPCINTGTAYLMLNDEVILDMQSTEYTGSAPDMGVYEFEDELEPLLNYLPISVDYGEILQNQPALQHVIITNDGFGMLNISNIAINSDDVELSATGYDIAPGFSETLNLIYTPTSLGEFSFTLTFVSNSPGQENIAIPVTATVASPPEFTLNNSELIALLLGEDDYVDSLLVINTGGITLSSSVAPGSGWIQVSSDYFELGADESIWLVLTINSSSLVAGDYITNIEFMTNDPDQPFFNYPITIRKEYYNFTTTDNLNNVGEMVPDDDLDVYLGNGSAIHPVEFIIYHNPAIPVITSELLIVASDVDSNEGERCEVYLNDNLVGELFGVSAAAITNRFEVPPEFLSPDGINVVRIQLDVDNLGDNAMIDSGQLRINSSQGGAVIRYADLGGDRYYPGSIVSVLEEIDSNEGLYDINLRTVLTQNSVVLSRDSFSMQIDGLADDAVNRMLGIPVSATVGLAYLEIFVYNSLDSCDDYLRLPITIEPHVPEIEITMQTLDFGVTPTEVPVVKEFEISNIGLNTLIVNNITTNLTEYLVNPTNCSIPPNSTLMIQVTFTPLTPGDYNGFLTIQSNDDDESFLLFDITGVAIENIPYMEVSEASLDFGSVFNVLPSTQEITITNSGPAIMSVSWESLSNGFIVPAGSADLANGESTIVTITFAPQAAVEYNETLQLTSNAPNALTLDIQLTGTGVLAPVMSLSTSEYNLYLQSGIMHNENLLVQNTGQYPLNWIMHENLGSALQLDGVSGDTQYGVIDNSGDIQLFGGEFTVEIWFRVDSDYSQTPTGGYTSGGTGRQYIFSKSSETTNGFIGLYTDGRDTVTDDKELHFLMKSFSGTLDITLYDCLELHTWNHFAVSYLNNQVQLYLNNSLVGSDTIADYNGNTDPWVLGKLLSSGTRWYRLNGMLDEFRIWDTARTSEDIFRESHCALSGTESGLAGYWDMNDSLDDRTGARNDGALYGSYEFIPSSVTNTPVWFASSINGAVTGINADESLQLSFDTTDLIGGDYSADIVFESNDPVTPTIVLPVNLVVTGEAGIAFNPDNLDFGSTVIGITDTLSFSIINTGSDLLSVTGIQTPSFVFSPSITSVEIPAGSSARVVVSFTPITDVESNSALTIHTNLTPSDYQINLTGTGILPPSADVQPMFLNAVLDHGIHDSDAFEISNTILNGTSLQYSIEIEENTGRNNVSSEYANLPLNARGLADVFGIFYVIDYDDNLLVKYNKDTESIIESIPIHTAPWGISVSSDGYWIGSGNGTFYHYDFNANLLGSFSNDLMTNPSFCCDGTNLYVTNNSIPYAQVYKVAPDGTVLQTYNRSFPGAANALVWVNAHELGSLWAYDSSNNLLRQLRIGNTIAQLRTVSTDDWGTCYGLTHSGRDLYIVEQLNGMMHRVDDGIYEFNWLSLDSYSGSVEASNQDLITVQYNTDNLFAGDYNANIVITTNDPLIQVIDLPVSLTVNAQPQLLINESFDFGTVYANMLTEENLFIANNGYATLEITSISSTLTGLGFDESTLSIAPWGFDILHLNYQPTASGDIFGEIIMLSNDPDMPGIIVNVTASVVGEPEIQLDQTQFQASLYDTETQTTVLRIENTGGTPLNYQIFLEANSSRENPPLFHNVDRSQIGNYAPEVSVSHSTAIDSRIVFNPSGRTLGELYETLSYPVPAYSSGMAWINGTLHMIDRVNDELKRWNTENNNWDIFPIHDEAYSITYDGTDIWISNQSGYVYSYDTETLVATGSSFDTGFADFASITFDGEAFLAVNAGDTFTTIRRLDYQGNILLEGTFPEQGLLTQIVYVPSYLGAHLWGYFFPAVENDEGNISFPTAELINITDNAGSIVISKRVELYDDRKCDALACDGQDFYFCDYDGPVYRIDDEFWLSAKPYHGTVLPGAFEDVDVTMDSNHLTGGTYNGNLYVVSNDPDDESITLPVTMQVTGVPQIELSTYEIDFGVVPTIDSEQLSITVSNSGTDVLQLSNIQTSLPEFIPELATLNVNPGGEEILNIYFQPTQAILYSGTLVFDTNVVGSPGFSINLSGEGVIALPQISVPVSSLTAGTVAIGQTSLVNLTISNIGLLDLEISSIATTTATFSPDINTLTLIPGESDTLWISFEPLTDGLHEDILSLVSNDPVNPVWEISLQGNGYEPDADLVVNSEAIGFGLVNIGMVSTMEVTLSNIGIGTLHITEISSSNPVFEADVTAMDIPSGQSRTVNISFTPIDETVLAESITIYSNDLAESEKIISLTGEGQYVPVIGLSDTSFEWFIPDAMVQNSFLTVSNSGLSELYVLAEELNQGIPWLSVSPDSIIIQPDESGVLTLTVNTTGLNQGLYQDILRIRSNDPLNRIIDVNLLLNYGGYNFTTNDNENNTYTGTSDNDLDIAINEFSAQAPVEFNIFVNESNVSSAQLRIRARDIDQGENCPVYLNDTYLGDLRHIPDIWSISYFPISPDILSINPDIPNHVRIELDVNHADPGSSEIDSGLLILNNLPVNASIYNLTLASTDLYQGSDLSVTGNVITNLVSQNLILTTRLIDSSFNVIDETAVTVDIDFNSIYNYSATLNIPSDTAPGMYQAVLVARDPIKDMVEDIESLEVEIDAYQPQIVLVNPSVDFQNCFVGVNTERNIVIANSGYASLELSNIQVTGTGFSSTARELLQSQFSSALRHRNISIPAGQSEAIPVILNAVSEGEIIGNLSFNTNDLTSPTVNIPLYATASYPPEISFNPLNISKSVYLGMSDVDSLLITNNGQGDLHIYDIYKNNAAWLQLLQSSMTIPAGTSDYLNYAVSAGTLGDGHYIGQVTFLTNVPDNETVNIQAHLEVVDRPVIASFSVDVPQGYAPLAVQFTDTSSTVDGSTITGWAWDFESDGSIDSSEQNPSHIFSTKGSYDVTLTVTNNNNISNTAIIEDCIEVLNTPPVLISNIPDQEIVINSVNNELNLNNYFTDVDNDPLLYYASGYSHCSVLIQNGFVTVTTGAWQGIDRIIFTARDNSNAIVRDTISVRIRPVNEPPVLDLPASITFLMNTSEVVDFAGYISDSDQTDDELTLSFTDNIHTHFSVLGTVVTISVDPDWSGSEAVTVNLDDNQGGEATTGTLLIEVLDSLNPVFEVDNMAPWGGEAIHFTDYTEGNVAVWEWDFESDNTIDSYFQNPTHTYNISGDYYVTLTVRAEPGGTPYSYTMTDPIIVNGTGIPGGDIIDETWTPASSPYNVFGQITVPTTGRLEIQQDVVVNVFTDSMFIIQGELIANQAVFATEMPSNWGGLRFLSGSDDSNLDGCHLFNAENPIQIDGASPNLDGITITAEAIRTTSSGTAIMITGDASPIITNLSVSGYASGLEISGTDAGNPFLQNISFLNSGTPRTVDGAGVVISSSATIDSLTVEDYPTGILFENTTQTPTLTNVRVRNSDNTVRTLDYGVTMSGTVSVDISGLTIEGYTTGIDMNNELGSAATPTLTNVRIRNTDNTTRPDSRGITVSGNVDGTLTDVEINDFAIAVAYEQTGVSETTPTLTNVRVVNSTNTTRLVGEGFLFVGSVACQLSDIEIENCSSGIEIMNNQRTVSTPTLTNVRVRNSENTARPDSKGIYITGSVGPTLDDVDVENMGVGIEFDQMDSGTTTPTLTNVRVRNTDNTVRTAVTGIKVTQSSTVSMTDTEVNDYPQGIEFQNDSTSTMITPTLTNVRVRNTDNTVRQRPLRELDETVYAVKAVGKICLNVDDFQAENTGNGIIYEQQGTLGTSVPSLTNVRVRNSENTTRPNAYGLFLKNIPLISCSNDTLSGIDYGLVYQNLSNERANPVLTNVRIRNSENATRLIGVGVELGNNIDAIIRGCEITGFNTGIRVLGNNNSEIVSNDLFNNAIGMELSSTLGTIEKNAIVATANMAPQMITALSVVNNAALDVSKFTIDNYPRAVEATNCSVQLTNSIIWGQSTIVQPYLSTNAIISSAYCNTYTDAPVAGVGNINSEPMFVDAANGDYRLNFESPMIDAGDPDADGDGWSYYEGDMDDADPDGTRLDMGSKYYRHYAHIVINDQTIIQGEPSSYHADTYGHIPQLVTYDWDFGDNSTSTDADVIHTYALPGVYSVRLIVTSGALVDTVYHENHVLVSQTLLPAPTNVGISASGNDITITWLPVLNDYYGNPVSVNHYLVYWSDSYDGDFYYLGDSGIIPSFTDVGVLHRVKYYRVIGFIGDLRSLNEYLTRTRGVLPKPNGISSQKSRLKRSKN